MKLEMFNLTSVLFFADRLLAQEKSLLEKIAIMVGIVVGIATIAGVIIAYLNYRRDKKKKEEEKIIVARGSVATGKSKVEHEEAGRDLLKAGRDIVIEQPPQPVEKVKVEFPLERSLHNQTPPEENFVGRKDMLKAITGWYKDKDVRIGALIGWGGVGKSALVRKWYDSLKENKIQPDGIFWWGFYRNAYLEQFSNALLRYVTGGKIEPDTIKSTWEKVERIKEYINHGTYLIVLDGLEQMQKGQVSGEQFGCMEHRECSEMLKFLADTKGKGMCLITTRYPLTDIKSYEGKVYQKIEVERLSIEDGRALFKKVGVKGKPEEIDSVIKEYDGYALSLTLLSRYLVEDFEGDITKTSEIPPFYSDEEAGGKAHRILQWYAKQLNEEQRAFMKIFSLFRRAVREKDFEGVFRAEMETGMNQVLRDISEFKFKRMVDNLVDRRLISRDQEINYATHPLIKSYFESIFDQEDKKLCHKCIYRYIGEYAPERPETLEQMQPLFEQVYHGCAAGLYDKAFSDVYWGKIYRGREFFIYHNLGAWDTNLSLAKTFFPEGDLSQMPLVSERSDQSWLLNEAGLALKTTGRPKEAEEPILTGVKMDIEAKDWENASVGYRNLADLEFRIGELESGLDSAKKALEISNEAKSYEFGIWVSKVYFGWILYLSGKTEEAEKEFRQADEICIKVEGNRLRCLAGVLYGYFLISMERIDEAFELIQQNLELCQRNNLSNDISRCNRCLGAIERVKGNYKEAEIHLQNAFEIARKVGRPDLEVEALIERGRLSLDIGNEEDAIGDARHVLKICGRTGFRFYEPEAEIILGKAYLAQKKYEQAPSTSSGQAEVYAKSAYEKAVGMKYRWAEGDAGHLLGEIYIASSDKIKTHEWLQKAVACRKEIKDPKVKESKRMLESL